MEASPVPAWLQSNPNPKLGSRTAGESDMVIGALASQKSGADLMQNCDLPPPMKVFIGSDNAVGSPINRIFSMMGRENGKDEFQVYRTGGEEDKLELLKALRLSQTRAREAERKAVSLAEERDQISNALLEESMRLFAHRQWVRLLEIQVSELHSKRKNQEKHLCHCYVEREGNEGEDKSGIPWLVALAFCLGIAGIGFAFGCRYLF
ncbi:hypothetical protein SLEP1_g33190 [Rubroshorea leprosula]|uniref:Transmembrane protein n=1 Tax=Rubroshorea leprosula TaxID=152421 RepID=A0AAV5KG13_9ROSI|nr:hypothetical protein SLEP1_g33190 [Rubroshorea leprosula]